MLARLWAVVGWLLRGARRRRVARVPVTIRTEMAWPWWAGPECLEVEGIDPADDLLDPPSRASDMPGQLVFGWEVTA